MILLFRSIFVCSVGVYDVVAELCVEFIHMLVSGGRELESIAFRNESLGDVGKVGRHVKDLLEIKTRIYILLILNRLLRKECVIFNVVKLIVFLIA